MLMIIMKMFAFIEIKIQDNGSSAVEIKLETPLHPINPEFIHIHNYHPTQYDSRKVWAHHLHSQWLKSKNKPTT